jgi:putative transposase
MSSFDDHRDPAHGEGRRDGGVVVSSWSSVGGAQLGVGACPSRAGRVDRGGQVAGDRAGVAAGKSRLDLTGPLPARVPGETKEAVLKLIDEAVAAGAPHAWACRLLGVPDDRVHRWRARLRIVGTLEDRAPGGVALHAVTPTEIDAILAITEQWDEVDRSHRKLAHRGSYVGRVWVSPSTFRRVLAAHGLVLPEPPARDPTPRPGWPDWLEWAPNRIWCWDVTHFSRAKRVAFAIIDVVSRR